MKFLFALALLCLAPSISNADFSTNSFGAAGSSGSQAQSGQDGQSARSATVFIKGENENIILRGQDGFVPQSPGGEGANAYSCDAGYNPNYNLQGAVGGDGGNGGNGGAGGNGGDVTIYYHNRADLQKVYIDSSPGRGAQGGPGGRGGDGCICQIRSWYGQACRTLVDQYGNTETDSDGNPVQSCNSVNFFCQDGSRGRDGAFGSSGSNGTTGTLTLIQRDQALQSIQQNESMSLSQSLSMGDITLSENVWAQSSGASSLLAPGSIINDTYNSWVKRRETNVVFESTVSAQDLAPFAGERITASLNNGKISLSVPDDVKILSQVEQPNENEARITFQHVMRTADVTRLRGSLQGTGSELRAVIADDARVSKVLKNYLWLNIFSPGLFKDTPLFQGNVPDSAVEITDGQIVVNLGRLVSRTDLVASGKKVSMQLKVSRYLGGQNYGDWWYNLTKTKLQ